MSMYMCIYPYMYYIYVFGGMQKVHTLGPTATQTNHGRYR